MRKRKVLVVFTLLLFVVLTACSSGFKPDTFTKDELCIINTDSKEKICHGQSRSDVEKILGNGVSGDIRDQFHYDFGIEIWYREDDSAAMIIMNEDSKGLYTTARGASVGDLKSDIKSLYGEKYALDSDWSLDYFYDTENGKFLGSASIRSIEGDYEKLIHTDVASFIIDDDGYVDRIYLMDRRMANLLY